MLSLGNNHYLQSCQQPSHLHHFLRGRAGHSLPFRGQTPPSLVKGHSGVWVSWTAAVPLQHGWLELGLRLGGTGLSESPLEQGEGEGWGEKSEP